jgi:inorganic pyrophosphatase
MKSVRVKIEIPRDSDVKYEMNKETGVIEVDRILKVKYPFNYGFVPHTLWDDGDPLDVILLGNFVLHPGVELDAKIIGMVEMFDNEESDYKLICAFGKEKLSDYEDTIVGFLKTYKHGTFIRKITTNHKDIQTALNEARRAHVACKT